MIAVKLKDNHQSYMWKIWDNKKVWTVSASDVEWVQFEHHPKTQEIVSLESRLGQLKEDMVQVDDSPHRHDLEVMTREVETRLNVWSNRGGSS